MTKQMMKSVLNRFGGLLLAAFMLLSLIPAIETTAKAAGSLNTEIAGLSAAYDNGTWNISGNTITGTVKTSSSSGCTGTTYTAQTGTLTFTNTGSTEAILSYMVSLSSGTGSILTPAGNISVSLAAGATATVSVISNNNSEDTSVVTIKNISFSQIKEVAVTYAAAEHGSYSVDGEAVTSERTITKPSSEKFALAATAASGYQFLGWYDVTHGTYFSLKASDEVYITESITIRPDFAVAGLGIFETGGQPFSALNEAVSYAQNNSQSKITLIKDGTLPAGSYTIPSGITLLIPFDDAHTMYTANPAVVYGSHTNPTAYRTLAMASGASITVAGGGALNLSGKLSSSGQMGGWNGTPTGPDGRINMQAGSSITVENGGALYCWGYIYGSGSVEAKSGATVYEAFQIKDWRGGTATSNIYDYAFIFSQYYVQNIEVPLKINSGATEKLYSAANASGSAYPISATFVGNGGMFTVSSGYMIKDYIEGTDRLNVELHGNASVSPMTISGLPLIGSISTSSYILPINGNITVEIQSGTTMINQDIELLPGAEVKIADGASMSILSGKKVYVYDNDDWGNFTGNARLYVIGYSVANGVTAKRNANSLKDVEIDVNGTVNVSGNFYTSVGGANIKSSQKTGEVILSSKPTGDSTIYEMANNSTKTAVTFNPARLHNGDGTYTATDGVAAGTTYFYCPIHDKWETECSAETYTITWKNYDGTILKVDEKVQEGTVPSYSGATPEKPADAQYTYTFAGWDPEPVAVTGDVTYTATYSSAINKYNVTWKNADGSVLEIDTEVSYGETPVFNGTMPTKPADESYHYTASWTPEIGPVTGNAEYLVSFTEEGHSWDSGEITTQTTCSAPGVRTYTCTECGHTKTEEVAATGHTEEVIPAVAATCTETGLTEGWKCSVCGEILTAQEEIPALGHDYVAVVTAPSCTDRGYTTYTCSRCGDSYVDNYTDALGHDWGEWTVTTAPTCTEAGEETRSCSRCEESETRAVDALGHDLVHHEAQAQTCTEIGWEAYDTCSRCDYTTYVELPAAGHTEEVIPAVAATCTEAGLTEGWKCSVCGEILTAQEEIPALGHDYVAVVTAPTCTDRGFTTYTCSRCGDSYVDNYTDALGHDWGEWTVTTAPTCTEAGEETRNCSRCEESETRAVDALGHDLVHHEAHAPTCMEIGWDEYDTCSRCDYTTYVELPAAGHTEEVIPAVAATCTEAGLTEGWKCSVCGEILTAQEEVPALGHDYVAVVTAPTCTDRGFTTYTCSRCGDSYVDNYTDALGHDWGEWTVTTAPTCTEAGEETRNCSRCEESETRAVDALGHDWMFVDFTWSESENSYIAAANYVCANDESHTEAVSVNITSTMGIGENAGMTVYIAEVSKNDSLDGQSHSDTKAVANTFTVEPVTEVLTYIGQVIEPAVTVMDGEAVLEKDRDYEVTYAENKNAGTATATVTGIGSYCAAEPVTIEFTINPADLSTGSIADIGEQAYTGSQVTPNVTVTDGSGNKLKADTDYTISYDNNVNAGTATVTITGTGNYTGKLTAEFIIKQGSTPPPSPGGGGGGGGGGNPPAPRDEAKHMAYINGKGAGMFDPDGKLTRAEAAALLARLTESFKETGYYAGSDYTDVAADNWFYKYVSFAEAEGIFTGYEDGSFRPNSNITRAEFATAIVRFLGLPAEQNAAADFSDTAGHWAESYIAALQSAGIVEGYNGKYNPNDNITRAEAVTILNRALEREPDAGLDITALGLENPFSDVSESAWYYLQILEAAVEHLKADFHGAKG